MTSLTGLLRFLQRKHRGLGTVDTTLLPTSGAARTLITEALHTITTALSELEQLDLCPGKGGVASSYVMDFSGVEFTDAKGKDQTAVVAASLQAIMGSTHVRDKKVYKQWKSNCDKLATALESICATFELCFYPQTAEWQGYGPHNPPGKTNCFDVTLWQSMGGMDALLLEEESGRELLPQMQSFSRGDDKRTRRSITQLLDDTLAAAAMSPLQPCATRVSDVPALFPQSTPVSRTKTGDSADEGKILNSESALKMQASAIYTALTSQFLVTPSNRTLPAANTHLISRLIVAVRFISVRCRTLLTRLIQLLLYTPPESYSTASSFLLVTHFLTNFNSTVAVIINGLQEPETSVCFCFMLSAILALHRSSANGRDEKHELRASADLPNDSDSIFSVSYLLRHIICAQPTIYHLITAAASTALECRSAAFSTLRILVFNSGTLGQEILSRNSCQVLTYYDTVLLDFNSQLSGDSILYRQALRFLFEILSERRFIKIMIAYIQDPHRLNHIFQFFLDENVTISFEAFQLLKLFISNPKKPFSIISLLTIHRNDIMLQLNMVGRQTPFLLSGAADELVEFRADRDTVIDILKTLPPMASK